MHRAVTVAVVIAVLAGSVPAAATLADGTPSDPEPGASFAAVVGVQGAEVDNEVANRSLNQRLAAAESNSSKASVVASESQTLETQLAELEEKKAALKAAYEAGNISKGQYTARLAVLSAELRAVERRANHTAETAETLPAEALQAKGTNVSEVREIAQRANRTGGGEVAEAARSVDSAGVGNGLGNAAGPGQSGNSTDRGNSADNGQGNAGNSENVSTNGPGDAENGSNAGDNAPADPKNESQAAGKNASTNQGQGDAGAQNGTAANTTKQTAKGSDNNSANASNGSDRAGNSSAANGNRNETTTSRPSVGEMTFEGPQLDFVTEFWTAQVDDFNRMTQPFF